MKKIIRLTESDLHRIVKESVTRILTEMDGASSAGDSGAFVGGGVALGGNSTSSIYDTSTSNGRHEGGRAQSKEVTDVPLGGIIRKGHNLGKRTNKKENGVDISDALDRTGGSNHSIAINHLGESKDVVEEGWFKNAALGSLMALGAMGTPQTANAQGFDNSQNTVQFQKQNMADNVSKMNYRMGTKDLTVGERNYGAPTNINKAQAKQLINKIVAVGDNLSDLRDYISNLLAKDKTGEMTQALLRQALKNSQTNKTIDAYDMTLSDIGMLQTIYDGGDNIIPMKVGDTTYFFTVPLLDKFCQVMQYAGSYKTSPVVKTFKFHN